VLKSFDRSHDEILIEAHRENRPEVYLRQIEEAIEWAETSGAESWVWKQDAAIVKDKFLKKTQIAIRAIKDHEGQDYEVKREEYLEACGRPGDQSKTIVEEVCNCCACSWC